MKGICIIVLAAGESSRMGQSKQLLKVDEETLLHRAVKTALAAEVDGVLVVLGSDHEKHKLALQDQPVDYVINPYWQKGIGSSIKIGLSKLLTMKKPPDAVLMMVCDQPFVTSDHLCRMIEIFNHTKKEVVASTYAGTTGTPALFASSIFNHLLNIGDNEGAKKTINQSQSLAFVELEHGEIDLDTPEDYNSFLQKSTDKS
ncbi:MAG TPA: nucleotidyltransferase family protein [Cyclobacteriaceae bacterium]|jgi:molybdenum cofactor cytidylyltransferase|nr:nucleotidyltransferase family protein [Cyclobacteriaceae bacterium]